MKNRILTLITAGLTTFLFSMQAKAICPICTIAVGAGIGLSRYLGIDDSVTGLWIGAFVVSLIMWTIAWFNKKNWHFKGRIIITTIAYYAMVVGPFYYTDIIGHPLNTLWGIDKLVLGTIIGSIAFLIGGWLYIFTKAKNNNKALFPFQKVVFPVVPLIILSVIFFFITR